MTDHDTLTDGEDVATQLQMILKILSVLELLLVKELH